jgi:hypothetical protein
VCDTAAAHGQRWRRRRYRSNERRSWSSRCAWRLRAVRLRGGTYAVPLRIQWYTHTPYTTVYIAGGPRAGRAVKEALTVHGALDCGADRRCCKGSALRSLHWGVLEPCLFARHCIDGDHTGGLGAEKPAIAGLHSLCVAPLRFIIRKAILGTNQLAPATIDPLATARCCRFSPLRLPLAAHVAVLNMLGQPAPAVRFLHAPLQGGN